MVNAGQHIEVSSNCELMASGEKYITTTLLVLRVMDWQMDIVMGRCKERQKEEQKDGRKGQV